MYVCTPCCAPVPHPFQHTPRAVPVLVVLQATEASVRAALQQAGFVWELTLPRGTDGKLRGFAFAAFITRAQAEKAIKFVNGTVRAMEGHSVSLLGRHKGRGGGEGGMPTGQGLAW